MDIRDEIISRAEQMFLKLGIRSITMDDMSREMGISKKTLYQYFDNKDALVEAVINKHVNREQQIMDGICSHSTDAMDEIRNMGAFITATIEDISMSAMFDLQKYYRKSWELLMDKQDNQVMGCIVKNIDRGIREGLYRSDLNPEIIAKIYSKAAYMVVDEISNTASKFSRRELIWELHNYHMHAIATPKGIKIWEKYSHEMKFYDVQKPNINFD